MSDQLAEEFYFFHENKAFATEHPCHILSPKNIHFQRINL